MKNIVVFGITGDLVRSKLIPSIQNLYRKGFFSDGLNLIGFGRKKLTEDEQRSIFSDKWEYIESELDDIAGYEKISNKISKNLDSGDSMVLETLVYISLPPQFQKLVLENLLKVGSLRHCGLVANRNVKILIEKPFGSDLTSAMDNYDFIKKHNIQDCIYLVDHYACKQAIVDFETLGIAGFFDEVWSVDTSRSDEVLNSIQSVKVSILEKKGVEGRGAFYDKVGAIKDVGQNHCLRVLTSVLMVATDVSGTVPTVSDKYMQNSSSSILETDSTKTRAEILQKIVFDNVKKVQHPRYQQVEGISSESNTETYFEISGKYKGTIDVIIEGGKYQPEDKSEVVIVLKDGRTLVLPINGYKGIVSVQDKGGVPDAYENVIKFAFENRREYFVEFDEVLEQWRLVS
jgi:glucose-6-phosphate 1-dehydrogenase